MPRTLNLIFAGALALVFCLTAHSQDSPSLGDMARQAQKDKANKPTAKVFTNDDISGSGSTGSAVDGSAVQEALTMAAGNAKSNQTPADALQKLELTLDHLDSLDRTNLALEVLAGNNSSFPGRAKWEEKLFNAKQTFVTQTRVGVQKTKQLVAESEQMKDPQGADDPRIKILSEKLSQLVRETRENGAAFDAVIQEGKALAEPPPLR